MATDDLDTLTLTENQGGNEEGKRDQNQRNPSRRTNSNRPIITETFNNGFAPLTMSTNHDSLNLYIML